MTTFDEPYLVVMEAPPPRAYYVLLLSLFRFRPCYSHCNDVCGKMRASEETNNAKDILHLNKKKMVEMGARPLSYHRTRNTIDI